MIATRILLAAGFWLLRRGTALLLLYRPGRSFFPVESENNVQIIPRLSERRLIFLMVVSALFMASACDDGGSNPTDTTDLMAGDLEVTDLTFDQDSSDQDLSQDQNHAFDDHTIDALASRADFEAYAAAGIGRDALKFIISDFSQESAALRFLDGAFYTMHDEWYWFRLLNGQPAPGSDRAPASGLSFMTIGEAVDWASGQSELPLDLRWAGDERLYSPEFYSMALAEPRRYAVGSLLRIPERLEAPTRPELWLFELEYSDNPNYEQLVEIFQRLEAALPEAESAALMWVLRSPQQEDLAETIIEAQLPYWDRIIHYSELAVPGEVEVYSEGITAGRTTKILAGEGLENTRTSSFLLLEEIPDILPPAAGLITALPQTPLAHINVLARNRGIPNAYLGGLMEDPAFDQLARINAPIVVRAQLPDRLDFKAITNSEYQAWVQLTQKEAIQVDTIDWTALPYTIELDSIELAALNEDGLRELRLSIGGKSTGFVYLLAVEELIAPDAPLAITVRAYAEHVEALASERDAMLNDAYFLSDSRARLLLLRGRENYDQRYSTATDQAYADNLMQARQGTLIEDIVQAGGFQRMLRDQPIDPATLSAIEQALNDRFGHYSPYQGLRFRSSSSVEDIEGFNGAGLYDSNTGFFEPERQADSGDHKKSIAWALKKTWASYWSVEGVEERILEEIDHQSGLMGVLVHARFDDPLEQNNGVFTFTLAPAEDEQYQAWMVLNVQKGAESVTNPTPGLNATPEINEVYRLESGALQIERRAGSNLVEPGVELLSDAQLEEVFLQAEAVTELWLAKDNEAQLPERRSSTLTLDFEFRDMAAGWPGLDNGQIMPSRIVIKQARSLEPGLRTIGSTVRDLPIPRDLLARSAEVRKRVCAGTLGVELIEVSSDPMMTPDMGYAQAPFVAALVLSADEAIPELGWSGGRRIVLNHLYFDTQSEASPWLHRISIHESLQESVGLSAMVVDEQTMVVTGVEGEREFVLSCEDEILHASPATYLEALLAED